MSEQQDQSESEVFRNVQWNVSQILTTLRRSHEDALHEGRRKERALIGDYLELVGLLDEAKIVRGASYLNMLPKERKKKDG